MNDERQRQGDERLACTWDPAMPAAQAKKLEALAQGDEAGSDDEAGEASHSVRSMEKYTRGRVGGWETAASDGGGAWLSACIAACVRMDGGLAAN